MPKKAEKLEEIKIRVTKEEKELIKTAAASRGITMTKFILDKIVPTAKRDIEVLEHEDIIGNRIVAMDNKIEILKGNMEHRRVPKKENKLKSFCKKIMKSPS
ncbi:type II toxin -antitoxin system TacA 1-like antitoxin [Clostridium perfringens]